MLLLYQCELSLSYIVTLLYTHLNSVFNFFLSSRRRHTRCAISDWSSDVCSSDLLDRDHVAGDEVGGGDGSQRPVPADPHLQDQHLAERVERRLGPEIGRASCRERGCKYV